MISLKNRTDSLHWLTTLPHQSLCFQWLHILWFCHLDEDESRVPRYYSDHGVYFESKGLRKLFKHEPPKSSAYHAVKMLVEAGFVRRLIINQDGREELGRNYRRGYAVFYFRLSPRGLSLFEPATLNCGRINNVPVTHKKARIDFNNTEKVK